MKKKHDKLTLILSNSLHGLNNHHCVDKLSWKHYYVIGKAVPSFACLTQKRAFMRA